MPDFICPFCGSDRFWKNGVERGRQKYKCFECYKQLYNYYPVKFKLNFQEQNQSKKFDFCDFLEIADF